MKKDLPEWVIKQKRPGTQITQIGKNYYLYKISSKWDPKKKRSQKITDKYLGKITKECVVPPRHIRVKNIYKQISVKEYGATYFLQSISQDIIKELKRTYPYYWKELLCLAIFRLMEKSPLKRMRFYYMNSYISETLKEVRTSGKFLGNFLREIGIQRELMKQFMRSFMIHTDYALIDLTDIFSYSKGLINAMLGHNKSKTYLPQINLILIYSLDKMQPVYFRQVPGSIRDVSTIIKTVNETTAENFILIGDKGFHSEDNVKELKSNEIDYVLALKRNSRYITYDKIKSASRNKFDGNFLYQKRNVWFYSEIIKNKKHTEQIITYLDYSLKADEENDLAMRINSLEQKSMEKSLTESEKENLTKYRNRLFVIPHRNGTLSVRTNLEESAEEVYQIMKSRVNIEQAFDTFKNVLDADRTYMHDDKQIEGWFFINFIAMQLYYKIYAMLLKNKLLNNYSPMDVLIHLKRIYMLKTKEDWQLSEIPKKSRSVIKKLGIDIPIT